MSVFNFPFLYREEFCKYLKRPDNKQEFVSQWQSSYNEIEQHLRQEDIMKAELHHRVEVSRINNTSTMEPPIKDYPSRGHNRNNLSTKDTLQSPKMFIFPYS